jgi:hypothetical protein
MQIELAGLLQLNRMNHVTYHCPDLVRPSIETFKAILEAASTGTLLRSANPQMVHGVGMYSCELTCAPKLKTDFD